MPRRSSPHLERRQLQESHADSRAKGASSDTSRLVRTSPALGSDRLEGGSDHRKMACASGA